MPSDRRVLTDEEKAQIRTKYGNRCYICEEPLDNYEDSEIEYDHIYAHVWESGEDLSNFAPIHASKNPSRKNCHKGKGTKTWYEYKEELRIKKELSSIKGLKDICSQAKESTFRLSEGHIEFNGKVLPVYNQQLNGKDNLYFFDEIDVEYLENDQDIQLRPLEDKILAMTLHLRKSIQLLPSLGRLDTASRKVKIFDGQHKAVAQIIGNRQKAIPCIVFIDPDVKELERIVFEAHSEFLQQRYKRSHVIDKLASQYQAKIDAWKHKYGDVPIAEKDILQGESKPAQRKFLLAAIIGSLADKGSFIEGRFNFEKDFVDDSKKKAGRKRPMLWDNYEKFVSFLVRLTPVEENDKSPDNHRNDELENVAFILQLLYWHAIRYKWNPENPQDEGHQLCVRYFYDKVFEVWGQILVQALRYAYEQKVGRALGDALCYREPFEEAIKKRFDMIFKRLFQHGVWSNPNYKDVFRSTTSAPIHELFQKEGLDYIYLTKLEV